jgi:Xaa-Pro aminopeptidase
MFEELFKKHNIEAYITLRSDEHLNEYICEADERVRFLTNFTGSNGVAVTCRTPVLYTDSRYYIQATNESREYKLMRMRKDPPIEKYLSEKLNVRRVGVCRKYYSAGEYESLEKRMAELGMTLVPIEEELVDLVWRDKPSRTFNEIYSTEHMKFSTYLKELLRLGGEQAEYRRFQKDDEVGEDSSVVGMSYVEKLAEVRKLIKADQALVIAEMDTIAWIYNLRGSDIKYNPVFFAYSVIAHGSAKLFVNKPVELKGVEVLGYDDFEAHARALSGRIVVSGRCNAHIRSFYKEVEYTQEVRRLQSKRSAVELEGFNLAYIYDGMALTQLFEWIEERVEAGITEEEAAEKLHEIKRAFHGYIQPSFDTICGSGANAAIIHHRASSKRISKDEMLLVDSGSQYVFGTTDTTRTLHYGEPTEEEISNFTLVLKGQLRAMRLRFSSEMRTSTLDSLVRMDLWRQKKDFGHSTGHGVGHFLCVHECPPHVSSCDGASEAGQVFSIEPGYYKEGEYGIRLENLVCQRDIGDGFSELVNLTLVPYHLRLVSMGMLDEEELAQLNQMSTEIRRALEPFLVGKPGHRYLIENTRELRK